MTFTQFATTNAIRLVADRCSKNPHMADSANMDHWRVTLRRQSKRMTIYFSMGYGHKGAAPKVEDVLYSIAADYTDEPFEGWAEGFGYNSDSRKAERTYKAVERQTAQAQRFLGVEAFERLLQCTEDDTREVVNG